MSLLTATLWAGSIRFPDVASQAGLNDAFYCGIDEEKNYILESLGGGVALFDFNRDGYLDAFFVTGSRFDGFPEGKEPTNPPLPQQPGRHVHPGDRESRFGTVGLGTGCMRG